MASKTDSFRTDLLASLGEILTRCNLEDRTENELDAYLNQLIEDLTHDFDRFARNGFSGTERGRLAAVERESRSREDRVKVSVISLLSGVELSELDERRVRDLKDELENRVVNVMGRFGAPILGGFVGETSEELIEMLHKKDWLIQQLLVTLGGYNLADLSAGEVRELHAEIEGVLKDVES
jgi:hypothetical protein